MATDIHPTAVIDSSAILGDNVTIGPFSIVGPRVTLGDNVWMQSNVRIDRNTTLGDGCRIYHGASLGNDPQDVKHKGEDTWLTIGPGTVMREFVTIHRGTAARGRTVVGSGCYFLNYVHIPHDCVVGDHVVMSNSVQVGGHADIGDWVVVGGLTGIHQFTRIGCHAMIGFGYRVIQDIPPYVLAAGEPLRPMGINKTGLERRGFSAAAIDNVRKIYGIFYRQRLKRSEALSKIREELPDSPEAECFVSFVENSERGIMR